VCSGANTSGRVPEVRGQADERTAEELEFDSEQAQLAAVGRVFERFA
jgi:hypothetical protein